MKSYTLICFLLSLTMILCPLISTDKIKDVFTTENDTETINVIEDKTNTTVKVMSASSKNIIEINLRDYLLGVVAAEMNPTYHEEAIKAQIIASHTLLLYLKNHRSDELGSADISDSPASHQGYLTTEQQKEKWGENYDMYAEKLGKCIDEVLNLTLQYNGEYINSVFHAISNGKTEDAKDVWGGEIPYLKSVTSIGDTLSPAYISTVEFDSKTLKEKLKEYNIDFSDTPKEWVEKISNTESGMVDIIKICGKDIKGTEIRTALGLKSSTFSVEFKDDKFIFTVKGYGHGVGMSQYGANHMANQGFDYKGILKHYYTGIEIVEI